MKVLAIVAHADDEALGAGATLAKHAAAGDEVSALFVADGEGARGNTDNLTKRKNSAQQAAKALGVKNCHFLDLPDNRLDSLPLLDIVQKIEPCIMDIKPDVIYTHNPHDLNIDHEYTARAVMTACRPVLPFKISSILAFETLSSTEWSAPHSGHPFNPDYFVDCTAAWDKKMKAIDCYKDEMRAFPHPRSPEAINALGIYRGAQAGFQKAEAFKVLRILNA